MKSADVGQGGTNKTWFITLGADLDSLGFEELGLGFGGE